MDDVKAQLIKIAQGICGEEKVAFLYVGMRKIAVQSVCVDEDDYPGIAIAAMVSGHEFAFDPADLIAVAAGDYL